MGLKGKVEGPARGSEQKEKDDEDKLDGEKTN